jgi:hypothetical protein
LPDAFTLRDLQGVHEAITGTTFNKPAFRRRMIDSGWIEPTGQREVKPPSVRRSFTDGAGQGLHDFLAESDQHTPLRCRSVNDWSV